VRAKDRIKTRPTLSRLLSQVPGAEQMNAGRAKLANAQTGCPSLSASIHPPPALALNGGKVKDSKDLKSEHAARWLPTDQKDQPSSSAVVALSAMQEEAVK